MTCFKLIIEAESRPTDNHFHITNIATQHVDDEDNKECSYCGQSYRRDDLMEWEPDEFTCIRCEHEAARLEQLAEAEEQ